MVTHRNICLIIPLLDGGNVLTVYTTVKVVFDSQVMLAQWVGDLPYDIQP